ncbi:MAG TPA: polysaccharide deacetylase family protein [Pirellulales bacterium]|nr:polysaccharide deacetylase family protein [Pirellulales bacterium]
MWKKGLLNLYYHASLPFRVCRNRYAAAAGRAPVMVLFYHRIANDRANEWTCPFALFKRQVRWLKRHFDLVSLAEAQARIRAGRNTRGAVSLTFDDGYAENCDQGLPYLIDEGVPCTYFVSTRHVMTGEPFAHDVARGKPLAPNTIDQLRALAAAGIEIGAHTRTHCNLGKIDHPDQLHDEVIAAGADLAAALGRRVRYFAFPFGQYADLNESVFKTARQAGYEAICSAYGGYNFPGDDPFHLQRIHADDDMIRFKNWLTVDPRKLKTRRYTLRAKPRGSVAPALPAAEISCRNEAEVSASPGVGAPC